MELSYEEQSEKSRSGLLVGHSASKTKEFAQGIAERAADDGVHVVAIGRGFALYCSSEG